MKGRFVKKRKRRVAVPSSEPGRAREYIKPSEHIQPGDRFVLFVRASSETQDTHRQKVALREALTVGGARAVGIIDAHCKGYGDQWAKLLRRARKHAKRHRAKLLATETSRFVRGSNFEFDKEARPMDADFLELRYWTRGITLVTLAHPDASPKEQRQLWSRQGQDARGGNRGGRPRNRRPGSELEIRVARRMRKRGYSYGEIAKKRNRPRSTVQSWTSDIRTP